MEKTQERTIGERIRLLREGSNMSQDEMAKCLKVSAGSVVSMYESGKRQLPVDLVLAYSRKFDVTTDWIIKGDAC